MSRIAPFADSADLVGDAAALAARASTDGYLFVSGLLPSADILDLRERILEVCAAQGFLAPDSGPGSGLARPGVRYREGDPEYMAAYDDIQRLESFHALAHHPRLLAVLRAVLGEDVLVHPRNIARVMFPQHAEYTTAPHQDYVHIQGAPDTWTAWIPLGDCPVELGGLEVLAGSHRLGLLPIHPAGGVGGVGVELAGLTGTWHGGDFRAGDALFFHSLTIHRAAVNRTPSSVRLSVDYRYQGVSQPIVADSLLPHFGRLTWDEIYQGWGSKQHQYYWRQWPLRVVERASAEALGVAGS